MPIKGGFHFRTGDVDDGKAHQLASAQSSCVGRLLRNLCVSQAAAIRHFGPGDEGIWSQCAVCSVGTSRNTKSLGLGGSALLARLLKSRDQARRDWRVHFASMADVHHAEAIVDDEVPQRSLLRVNAGVQRLLGSALNIPRQPEHPQPRTQVLEQQVSPRRMCKPHPGWATIGRSSSFSSRLSGRAWRMPGSGSSGSCSLANRSEASLGQSCLS